MFTETNEIRIETSTKCNYNCVFCARDSFTRKKEVMDNSLFDKILLKTKKELPHINTITLSGFGEFSTDNNWRTKVLEASLHFEKVHIVTNLSLLSSDDIDYLLNYIADLRISMYGISDETYKSIHNCPSHINYQQIVSKLNYAIKVKNSHQRVILNYLAYDNTNMQQIDSWVQLWNDKADLVEVWKPHNWIKAKNYRNLSNNRIQSCGRPFKNPIQVQVDGTVNICCFDYNGEMLIGDLSFQSFDEIYNGARMLEIQKLHKEGRADILPLCSVCDQRNDFESSKLNLIYNSKYSASERIGRTSTEYSDLILDEHSGIKE